MVRRNSGPGDSIVDEPVDTFRDTIREQRINRLSVRWGGEGAPFVDVASLYGGMMGYGLALEDDAELQHAPHPWIFIYSPHLKGVHDAGAVYPEYADVYADWKVVGYQTELMFSPYDRNGNVCEFKIHRRGAHSTAAFDAGVAFGQKGDFVKVTDAMIDHSNATALGLSNEEYSRNFWELTIISGNIYNQYLEDWDWFDRSQGANSSHYDPPL